MIKIERGINIFDRSIYWAFKSTNCCFDEVGEVVEVCHTCLTKMKEQNGMISQLDMLYVKIIKDLQEAGLLSKNYQMMCCNCYKEKNKILPSPY